MRTMGFILGFMVGTMLYFMSGCQESQRWGQGNPPAEYQALFGNDNTARLNFKQQQTLDTYRLAIVELADRLKVLEQENPAELAERVSKLEKAPSLRKWLKKQNAIEKRNKSEND